MYIIYIPFRCVFAGVSAHPRTAMKTLGAHGLATYLNRLASITSGCYVSDSEDNLRFRVKVKLNRKGGNIEVTQRSITVVTR